MADDGWGRPLPVEPEAEEEASQMLEPEDIRTMALVKIAEQLAEMNDNLKTIAKCLTPKP